MKILIFGQMGAGKDTFANALATRFNRAETIAMADPMKRMTKEMFPVFTENQLWGPSEERNKIVPGLTIDRTLIFETLYKTLYGYGKTTAMHLDEMFNLYANKWVDLLLKINLQDGGLSPRRVLQTLGTEFGRNMSKTLWIDKANHIAKEILGGGYDYTASKGLTRTPNRFPSAVIITDGRFRNELIEFRERGFKIINVIDSTPGSVHLGSGHVSELEQLTIPKHWFDFVVGNDKTLGLDHVSNVVDSLYPALTGVPSTTMSNRFYGTFPGAAASKIYRDNQ